MMSVVRRGNACTKAEKIACGLVGKVAQYSGDFMNLHDGHGVKREPLPYHPLPHLTPLDFRAQLVEDFDFGFFLQVNMPSLTSHRYRKRSSSEVSYSVTDDTNRVVHFSATSVSGDALLWEEIQTLHEKFQGLKSPKRKNYELLVDEKGLMSFIYDNHEIAVINPFGH